MAKPFLKWAGGKQQLMESILAKKPASFSRFVEPMVGGGAVLFSLAPERALINDLNEELISAYLQVKESPAEVHEQLMLLAQDSETYYRLRRSDRDEGLNTWPAAKRAARTIYLNKLGYNGLYRVNSSGQFNVPYSKRSNVRFELSEILESSRILANCEITNGTYLDVLERLDENDWVYFDPPYLPITETSKFTEYTSGGFHWDDHVRLKEACDNLNARGIKFLLSNSHAVQILNLYSEYNISVVFARRNINSDSSKRGRIPEVLISNY
jgi:DNA adenine methylase